MNFVEVRLEEGQLVARDFTYHAPEDVLTAIGEIEELVLGIRPEDIVVEPTDPTAGQTLEAFVDVVEPTGDENVVYLQTGERDAIGEQEQSLIATVSGMRTIESGSPVRAVLPPDAIHIFDAATGDALHTRRIEAEDPPAI